jgi:hypothetical protein
MLRASLAKNHIIGFDTVQSEKGPKAAKPARVIHSRSGRNLSRAARVVCYWP